MERQGTTGQSGDREARISEARAKLRGAVERMLRAEKARGAARLRTTPERNPYSMDNPNG